MVGQPSGALIPNSIASCDAAVLELGLVVLGPPRPPQPSSQQHHSDDPVSVAVSGLRPARGQPTQ